MRQEKQLINICLIPDKSDKKAMDFINEAIEVSKQLNRLSPSYYELKKRPESSIDSLPHCTISHVVIPYSGDDDKTMLHAVKEAVETVISADKITLSIDTFVASQANIFSKKDIINNIDNLTQARAYWFHVTKTQELMQLQSNVVERLSKYGTCITAQGEQYEPHFTLWANTVEQKTPFAVCDEELGMFYKIKSPLLVP